MTTSSNLFRTVVAATAALLLSTLCVGTAASGSLPAPAAARLV